MFTFAFVTVSVISEESFEVLPAASVALAISE